MNNIEQWIDVDSLIKPQIDWKDSGNGVLFSAVWLILSGNNREQLLPALKIQAAILECVGKGNLLRSPTNTHQEQWDNHLGLGSYAYFFKKKSLSRMILEYGLKHFGVFNTDGKLEFQDWLYRFPQIWCVYFIAAFPRFKFLAYPFALLVSRFMKPNKDDGSGTQLAWLYLHVMVDSFGFGFKKKYNEILAQQKELVSVYYGKDHPIIELTQALPLAT